VCLPLGIPAQIPASSLMPAPATGPDSIVSQAQVTSAPVAGVPESIQPVNQPLMPLPQTLNPYQDPLYPGFPLSEKGERAIAPSYSLCSSGEDLPKGENLEGLYLIPFFPIGFLYFFFILNKILLSIQANNRTKDLIVVILGYKG